jgi:glycosyltransferase involved in cell wall biosynthesis
MQIPIKVYLMGGENTGWALDADQEMTHQTMEALTDLVRLVPLEEADVVHSVWEYPLLNTDRGLLLGKRIICHVCNEVVRTFDQSCMIHAQEVVDFWVSQSHEAEASMKSLRLKTWYMPYTINPDIFKPILNPLRDGLRDRFGIPRDAYVISNFMRDSRGDNLHRPKPQKGVEILLQLLATLCQKGYPIHVLLAGPRRHWIRARFSEHGIPFTYIGQEISGDDNACNILDPPTVNLLYQASDLHLITSRWEGGPRAVLETAASKTPVLCSAVGVARDMLQPISLFSSFDEALDRIESDIRKGVMKDTLNVQFERVMRHHTPEANIPILKQIYENLDALPTSVDAEGGSVRKVKRLSPWRTGLRGVQNAVRSLVGLPTQKGRGLSVGLWHAFHRPPYGGGNQFMMALRKALKRQGVRVIVNRMIEAVDVHLCNSAWFEVSLFRQEMRKRRIRMLHRIDGPISLYRGTDAVEDEKVYVLNREFASATIYQSGWCFQRSLELGYKPLRPLVIHNAVDHSFFYPTRRLPQDSNRKIRLVAAAWSDNPRKGKSIYQWLDEHLDFDRFTLTFVGRIDATFRNIQHIPAQASQSLGRILREQDIYLAASENDPCSNALLEALACGLPALYLDSGGHGELTGFGGLPFNNSEQLLLQLDRLVNHYDGFRAGIWVESIDDIAAKYIAAAQELKDSIP